MNCPAEIQIRTVKVFSNYIVDLKACKSERMVRARKEEVMATLNRDLEKKAGKATIHNSPLCEDSTL